jgi:hypothetical protein
MPRANASPPSVMVLIVSPSKLRMITELITLRQGWVTPTLCVGARSVDRGATRL